MRVTSPAKEATTFNHALADFDFKKAHTLSDSTRFPDHLTKVRLAEQEQITRLSNYIQSKNYRAAQELMDKCKFTVACDYQTTTLQAKMSRAQHLVTRDILTQLKQVRRTSINRAVKIFHSHQLTIELDNEFRRSIKAVIGVRRSCHTKQFAQAVQDAEAIDNPILHHAMQRYIAVQQQRFETQFSALLDQHSFVTAQKLLEETTFSTDEPLNRLKRSFEYEKAMFQLPLDALLLKAQFRDASEFINALPLTTFNESEKANWLELIEQKEFNCLESLAKLLDLKTINAAKTSIAFQMNSQTQWINTSNDQHILDLIKKQIIDLAQYSIKAASECLALMRKTSPDDPFVSSTAEAIQLISTKYIREISGAYKARDFSGALLLLQEHRFSDTVTQNISKLIAVEQKTLLEKTKKYINEGLYYTAQALLDAASFTDEYKEQAQSQLTVIDSRYVAIESEFNMYAADNRLDATFEIITTDEHQLYPGLANRLKSKHQALHTHFTKELNQLVQAYNYAGAKEFLNKTYSLPPENTKQHNSDIELTEVRHIERLKHLLSADSVNFSEFSQLLSQTHFTDKKQEESLISKLKDRAIDVVLQDTKSIAGLCKAIQIESITKTLVTLGIMLTNTKQNTCRQTLSKLDSLGLNSKAHAVVYNQEITQLKKAITEVVTEHRFKRAMEIIRIYKLNPDSKEELEDQVQAAQEQFIADCCKDIPIARGTEDGFEDLGENATMSALLANVKETNDEGFALVEDSRSTALQALTAVHKSRQFLGFTDEQKAKLELVDKQEGTTFTRQQTSMSSSPNPVLMPPPEVAPAASTTGWFGNWFS